MSSLLAQLARYQHRLLTLVETDGARHYQHQFHPDLSPSGWHLGHCVFTENYWIREVIEEQPIDDSDRDLYVPEFSPKPARGGRLPAFKHLLGWARRQQQENLQRFDRLISQRRRHPLLMRGYLGTFLVEHYAQHFETLCQVRAQRQLNHAIPDRMRRPLKPSVQAEFSTISLPAGDYLVGQHNPHRPYDNEHPAHHVHLESCRLATRPATNAAYLAFMQDGGYEAPEFWSAEGWRWRQRLAVTHPCYWRRDDSGNWYGIGPAGAHRLLPGMPVSGLSYYEATAFARWAGGRLPHEHEWEAAAAGGLLKQRGVIWEWCANPFRPYAGFRAYPYDGYSLPYFDEAHFVLRGGSRHTCRVIKRASFRNYYEADKRHIFAGVRPAFD